MKNTTLRIRKSHTRLGSLLLTFLLGATAALAQGTPAALAKPAALADLAGKYEGTVKGSDERLSLDLKSQGGKFSGRMQSGQEVYDVTEGNFKDGTLSLGFGQAALLIAKLDGDKLVGDWMVGALKSTVELKRVPPAEAATPATPASPSTPSTPATPAAPAAPINLSGQWEAIADANGQPFPFLLILKIDGENVTGSSSSQLGDSTVKAGSWKDGHLVFQLEGQNGIVSLSATVVEGKLSGEFDYAGQLQGKWVAIKKN